MERKVARVHLLPGGGAFSGYRAEIFEFCLRSNIIGVGWYAGPPQRMPFTWTDYLAQQPHDDVSSVERLHQLEKGDLVWVRSPAGTYYIAEVRGPWEYKDTPLHVAMDIVNVRRVEFFQVPPASVVQGVINSFVPVTFQYIRDQNVVDHTIAVWKGIY